MATPGPDPFAAAAKKMYDALGADIKAERELLSQELAATQADFTALRTELAGARGRIGATAAGPIETQAVALGRGERYSRGGVVLPRGVSEPAAAPAARGGASAASEQASALDRLAVAGQRAARSETEFAAAEERVAAVSRTTSASIGAMTTEQNLAAAQMQRAAYNMQRYGALSSEAISRIGRGNATLREIAYQTGITTAKFGGWLVAGGALYTALGAVRALGQGAIDSASGVNQLKRVLTGGINVDEMQSQFRSLSDEFNLPIGTVTDAAYQMGKVFHDQNSALEASKSVLYAVKVGELDVATASRYLVAITNGFNLSAKQQQVVFDQVNQAQNRYNISIQSLLAGTAKAAGAFKLAGGDATHLIALITTLSKVTGQTGDVIGTAIQRSPHFIALTKNQEVLRQFNVDPKANIEQIYAQAIDVAKKLGPDKSRQLAEAIFGPQYGARVGTALLQHGNIFQEVLGKVDPKSATGSAKRELDTLLGSLSEQISRIGTELGILGSNLQSAGFFDLLGEGVKALNAMLHAVNGIAEAFNKLPAPLRHALALAIEMYGIFRILRFFNLGQQFRPGSRAAGIFTPPDYRQRQAGELIANTQTDLAGEQTSALRKTQALITDRIGAEQDVAAARRVESEFVEGSVDEQKAAANKTKSAMAKLNAVDAQIAGARQRSANVLQQQLITAESRRILRQNPNLTDKQLETFGRTFGVPIAPPRGQTQQPLPQSMVDQLEAAGINTAPTQGLLQRARTQMGQLNQRWTALSADLGAFGAAGVGLRAGAGLFSQGASRAYSSLRNLNLEQLSSGASKLRGGVGTAATRLRAGANAVGAAVGPVGLAIFAFFEVFDAWDQAASFGNELRDAVQQAMDSVGKSSADMESSANQIRSLVGNSQFNDISLNPLTGFGDVAALVQGKYDQMGEALDASDRILNQVGGARANLIGGYRVRSQDLPAVDESLLRDTFKTVTDGVRAGSFGAQEVKARLRQFIDAAQKAKSRVSDVPGLIADFRTQIAQAADASGKALGKLLFTTPELLQTYQERLQTRSSPFGAAAKKLFKGSSPQELAQATQTLSSFPDTASQAARDQLQQDLTLAKTQQERNRAYDEFIHTLQNAPFLKQLQAQRGDAQTRYDRARQAQQTWRNAERGYKDQGDPVPTDIQKNLRQADKEAQGAKRRLDAISTISNQTKRSLDALTKTEGRQARFDTQRQAFEAVTNIGSAQRTDPVAQARYQLDRTRKEIQKAIDVYGKDTTKYADLIAQEKQQVDALFQARVQRMQAEVQLRVARLGADTPAGIRASLQGARKVVQAMIDRYGRHNEKTIQAMQTEQEAEDSALESRLSLIQARADVSAAQLGQGPAATQVLLGAIQAQMSLVANRWGTNNARYLDLLKQQIALRDQQFQDQISLVQSQTAIATARAGSLDPVGQARAALQGAQRVLAATRADPHASQADINNAIAAVISARDTLDQAVITQAQGLADSAYQLREARATAAGRTVQAARIALNQAQHDLQYAQTEQQRREARANIVDKRAALEQAWFEQRLGNIQFSAEIDRITVEQEIHQLQNLLNNARLTRDQRRQILEEIHGLRDQAGEDLDVGNIKLPTIYDIRRAIAGGDLNKNQPNVQINNHVKVDAKGNPKGKEIGKETAKAIGGHNRSSMKSAGLL